MRRARRGRGESSIFQRKDGRWVGEVSAGIGRDGKRRRKTVYGTTKKEVQDKLGELRRTGGAVTTSRLSVGAYLTHWLDAKRTTVEPLTWGPYDHHVRSYIEPALGGIALVKLSVLHVEAFYAGMEKDGVSRTMQRKVAVTLATALNSACRKRLIPVSPAMHVAKPKAASVEIQPLDPSQASALLAAAEPDRLYAYFFFALDSGAGPGECWALRWTDVDLDGGHVVITKSLEQTTHRVKDVKRKSRRRRIDLSAQTVVVLRAHRERMRAEGLDVADGIVFCNREGAHLHNSNMTYLFKQLLASAGLPRSVRLYDLRHTCATLLLLANVSPKVVSERLGHAGIQITLDTYSHVLPTMQKAAAATIGEILGRGIGCQLAVNATPEVTQDVATKGTGEIA